MSHLYTNAIFLPRQAWDKHRESTQKPLLFSQVAADPSYYSKAAHDSDDFIRQGMEHDSAFNETTFSAAASRLPPPHDYAIVGKKIVDLLSVHSF